MVISGSVGILWSLYGHIRCIQRIVLIFFVCFLMDFSIFVSEDPSLFPRMVLPVSPESKNQCQKSLYAKGGYPRSYAKEHRLYRILDEKCLADAPKIRPNHGNGLCVLLSVYTQCLRR